MSQICALIVLPSTCARGLAGLLLAIWRRRWRRPGGQTTSWPSHLDTPCGKLDADRGLALQRELVPGEPAQQVGLSYATVSDQHDLEQVVVAAGRGQAGRRLPTKAPYPGGPAPRQSRAQAPPCPAGLPQVHATRSDKLTRHQAWGPWCLAALLQGLPVAQGRCRDPGPLSCSGSTFPCKQMISALENAGSNCEVQGQPRR